MSKTVVGCYTFCHLFRDQKHMLYFWHSAGEKEESIPEGRHLSPTQWSPKRLPCAVQLMNVEPLLSQGHGEYVCFGPIVGILPFLW